MVYGNVSHSSICNDVIYVRIKEFHYVSNDANIMFRWRMCAPEICQKCGPVPVVPGACLQQRQKLIEHHVLDRESVLGDLLPMGRGYCATRALSAWIRGPRLNTYIHTRTHTHTLIHTGTGPVAVQPYATGQAPHCPPSSSTTKSYIHKQLFN